MKKQTPCENSPAIFTRDLTERHQQVQYFIWTDTYIFRISSYIDKSVQSLPYGDELTRYKVEHEYVDARNDT